MHEMLEKMIIDILERQKVIKLMEQNREELVLKIEQTKKEIIETRNIKVIDS